nr:MAG TPA: hypothetical protein [Caudoviricetes sp.]
MQRSTTLRNPRDWEEYTQKNDLQNSRFFVIICSM